MSRHLPGVSASLLAVLVCALAAPVASAERDHMAAGPSVPLPAAARPVKTSHAAHVIGHGTPAGCTSAAVISAVRLGGVITFSCGSNPLTIRMNATAKVMNKSRQVVLDGGGLITLSGEGRRRILYMDTCDPKQVWTTSHCQDQASPTLVVQNLAFTDGNSTGEDFDGGGGGAIFDRGGRLLIIDSTFTGDRCERHGPDIGGGAVRALSQYDNLPVYVVGSSFTANVCSNGGALSSIGVSWTVLNSQFVSNRAIGFGANPAQSGTLGGGSGGAIYNDGDQMTLSIGGCDFTANSAREGGGAIFFVSDNRTGTTTIRRSTLAHNPNAGFQTAGLPGVFFLGAHKPTISDSRLVK